MNFEIAKTAANVLEAEVSRLGKVLQAYPRNAMGLVADAVRLSPEYQAHKKAFDRAFAELRKFNTWYVKNFKSEIRADRDAKRAAKLATNTI